MHWAVLVVMIRESVYLLEVMVRERVNVDHTVTGFGVTVTVRLAVFDTEVTVTGTKVVVSFCVMVDVIVVLGVRISDTVT